MEESEIEAVRLANHEILEEMCARISAHYPGDLRAMPDGTTVYEYGLSRICFGVPYETEDESLAFGLNYTTYHRNDGRWEESGSDFTLPRKIFRQESIFEDI